MRLKIVMADPAGNRTAIVRTPVPAAERAAIAAEILKLPSLRAEQAGFETAPRTDGAGRLEMMGGEFCGNAARSYGYLLWKDRQAQRAGTIQIEISGSRKPLEVACDPERGTSFVDMPLPERIVYTGEGYPLVVSEGITHMILQDMEPDEALIRSLVDRYGGRWDAFGMMFLKEDGRGERFLTPVVYVKGSGSLVFESSCGSGSLAAAWFFNRTDERPEALYRFQEPGGELRVRICRGGEETISAQMGGAVQLEEEHYIDIY